MTGVQTCALPIYNAPHPDWQKIFAFHMHSSGTVRHLPSLLTAAAPAEYAAQELLHSLCSEPGIIQTGLVTTIQLVPTAILRCRKEFALSHAVRKIRLRTVGIQITVHLHGKFETKSNGSHSQYITAFSTKYTHFSSNICFSSSVRLYQKAKTHIRSILHT